MKERLDVLLVKRNLAESREKAKAIIMSGNVFVEGQREDKAGSTFPEEVSIEVRGHTLPYVSRGGLKLEKAMNHFDIELQNKVCMDIGASTGGFTDCMLYPSGWENLSGYRRIDRRFYGLYAAKRCKQSLCGRCRIWTVCMETANR